MPFGIDPNALAVRPSTILEGLLQQRQLEEQARRREAEMRIAMARIEAQRQAEEEAWRRAQLSEQGALQRTQLGERGALERTLLGEQGATARKEMGLKSEAELERERLANELAMKRLGLVSKTQEQRNKYTGQGWLPVPKGTPTEREKLNRNLEIVTLPTGERLYNPKSVEEKQTIDIGTIAKGSKNKANFVANLVSKGIKPTTANIYANVYFPEKKKVQVKLTAREKGIRDALFGVINRKGATKGLLSKDRHISKKEKKVIEPYLSGGVNSEINKVLLKLGKPPVELKLNKTWGKDYYTLEPMKVRFGTDQDTGRRVVQFPDGRIVYADTGEEVR